ncbi:MAG: 23S rRNA (pseudouridine(1915)-N(3))-methyltransferase RlmH, partial [Candidatus Cloacimonetes bacterium]|nr:23S rRNA (pseudouridine(1915)-N(3))-methyltransferase RlmH [Candidatus Cloacimonadota bacterium]
VNNEVRKSVDLRISFSGFTLTHQMIRLFLSEQIYRAYTIITNRKYHK